MARFARRALMRLVPVIAGVLAVLWPQVPTAKSPAGRDSVRPALLLLHRGGFLWGSPESLDRATRAARRHGFRPVVVSYRLGDLSGAVADTVAAARAADHYGPVYAYGESSGGTLAARLAQRGLVRFAVANSPIADLPRWEPSSELVRWGMATNEELHRQSPARHPSRHPILAIVPRDDTIVSAEDTATWARRDIRVDLRSVGGRHILGNDYGRVLRIAFARLEREAATR